MKLLRYITEAEKQLLQEYSTRKDLIIKGATHGYLYYGIVSKLGNTQELIDRINEISALLSTVIEGFKYFSNFTPEGKIRFQYAWTSTFTGVGYITIKELDNGFEIEESN
jgi:hypothetical protein